MIEFLLFLIVILLVALISKNPKLPKYSGYLSDEEFPFRNITKIYKDANGLDYWGFLRHAGDEKFWINGFGLVKQTTIEATMVENCMGEESRLVDVNVLMTVSENVNFRSNWIGFYWKHQVKNMFIKDTLYLQVTKETYQHIKEILKNKKANEGLVYFMTGNRCKAKGGGNSVVEGYLIDSFVDNRVQRYSDFVDMYHPTK